MPQNEQIVSDTTIRLIAEEFKGGAGPTRATLEGVWRTAGAADAFPDEYEYGDHINKLESVARGLKRLRDGGRTGPYDEDVIAENPEALMRIVRELGDLLGVSPDDTTPLARSLRADGFEHDEFGFLVLKSDATPAGRLTDFVRDTLENDSRFKTAAHHYRQAQDDHERGNWEAANSQYRSTYDATLDELAQGLGCPKSKTGGDARMWLTNQGHLDKSESSLFRAYAAFAGENGSHAGLSNPAECQLRRHFGAALLTYAIKKLAPEITAQPS